MGPTRGGRATAVCGVTNAQFTFYLGTTGGGLWKTTDGGLNWNNISDGYFKSPSIGSIDVFQKDPSVVYVGTGSDGIRSNVIVGKGVYKSKDAGASWEFIGLEKTGQIGAVKIHPEKPETVYVAAIGQAFQPNSERGLYKTTDGGKTWDKILFISDQIGIVDFEFSPENPDIIYAASWEVDRKPWTILSGSDAGGIYKSVDGGENWIKLSEGLPNGKIGKIDLAVSPADPNRLYALIEADKGQGGVYISYDKGTHFKAMSHRKELVNRPFYYCNIYAHPNNADIVYSSANRFMVSEDAGKTWETKSTPHGDNHDIWINPKNENIWIQSNDGGGNITFNSGATWTTQFNQPTAEIYQVEVDTNYPYWLYGGQQDNYSTVAVPSLPPFPIQAGPNAWILSTGGCETGPAVPHPTDPNIVYSNCKGRFSVYNKKTGQEKQYYVGAQNMYGHNPKDLKYRFQRVSPIHISPHNENVIYHGSQFLHKTMDGGKNWERISPDLTEFDPSKQVISGAPITRDITGEEFYSTIYSIRESRIKKGQIWVGSNDGLIHVTQDGGDTWKNVTPKNIPGGGRVDSVEPSKHDPDTAYITILRYQLGDWAPHIYRTKDKGESWKLIVNGIPNDYPVRVVREDPIREGLLFAGTEFGMYISKDAGDSWAEFQKNLPITPITDLKIHRNDLVLSTMGRSFWIMDDIHFLRTDINLAQPALIEPIETVRYRYTLPRAKVNEYLAPGVFINYYLDNNEYKTVSISFFDEKGQLINSFTNETKDEIDKSEYDMQLSRFTVIKTSNVTLNKGFNRFRWNLKHQGIVGKKKGKNLTGPLVKPGTYKVQITLDGQQTLTDEIVVLKDPKTDTSEIALGELEDFQLKLLDKIGEVNQLAEEMKTSIAKIKSKKRKTALLQSTLEQLETQEGTYMQPMLIDQLRYLYSMTTRADQILGQDAYDRYAELSAQFDEIKRQL
ncbi:hypothetical protein OAP80_03705 [Flavobacteriaceae bacterium]|nr:hypothetical protein [Flavobacteriaceae bacterium]MDC0872489.1 hypothetical protein [Flavobacteriaceae bacterium]